jgi:hypothetical protein
VRAGGLVLDRQAEWYRSLSVVLGRANPEFFHEGSLRMLTVDGLEVRTESWAARDLSWGDPWLWEPEP